jgi:hypothetical protein
VPYPVIGHLEGGRKPSCETRRKATFALCAGFFAAADRGESQMAKPLGWGTPMFVSRPGWRRGWMTWPQPWYTCRMVPPAPPRHSAHTALSKRLQAMKRVTEAAYHDR